MNYQELADRINLNPLWYQDPDAYFAVESAMAGEHLNLETIAAFAHCLANEKIPLASWPEYQNDDDRVPITTAVIHHTNTSTDLSLEMLNAMGFVRLYAPLFKNKIGTFSGPVGSGHYDKNGKEVFYGYHYLVRENGAIENILKDEYTGFHAANYQVNCESIGIAVVDSLIDGKIPGLEAIKSIKQIIQKYPGINNIVGHKEVSKTPTECPGNAWESWKHLLSDSSIK